MRYAVTIRSRPMRLPLYCACICMVLIGGAVVVCYWIAQKYFSAVRCSCSSHSLWYFVKYCAFFMPKPRFPADMYISILTTKWCECECVCIVIDFVCNDWRLYIYIHVVEWKNERIDIKLWEQTEPNRKTKEKTKKKRAAMFATHNSGIH